MRDPQLGYLEYEAKVKPAIAALVARVDTMTNEEIDAAETPLPWFKIALKKLKAENELKRAGTYTDGILTGGVTFGVVPNPMGSMSQWLGMDEFIPVTGTMQIELKYGTLVWFPDDGGVWIESTFCKRVDARLANLPVMEKLTKLQYMAKYRERINRYAL